MKKAAILLLFIICSLPALCKTNAVDSLLKVLDKVVLERALYADMKKKQLDDLKRQKSLLTNMEEIYQINNELIHQYESFICDSAEMYINENHAIAQQSGNKDYITECKLRLWMIYSLSGLFVQAKENMDQIDYESLPQHRKAWYCWNYIRYCENMITYADDASFSKQYKTKKEEYRYKVMEMLPTQSAEYRKEMAFKLQEEGRPKEAINLLIPIFAHEEPGKHGYAMAAMSLARAYKAAEMQEEEEYYLILAAITDLRLAVKENEALLSLAINLHQKGDIDRAYNYIKVALDDALFYNARFKNSVIARVQPIIEDTYLRKIEEQQKNLKLYLALTFIFVVALTVLLFLNHRHTQAVSRARKELREMHDKLLRLNKKLDESNLVKERYIGYFMNQCAVYMDKLYEYRKSVNRKIKTGQIDTIYKSSSRELNKDIDELMASFDKAFLKIYPNFVKEFNFLLREEERYKLEDKLNTELRIYALIRLGITDVSQIANFLRYSMQTIYNYKSRVRNKAVIAPELFEEKVKKIGTLK